MKRNVFVFPLSLLLLIAGTTSIFAADVTLAWNSSSGSTLAGYKIYYGTASGVYKSSIDVGYVTTSTVTGLGTGTYYFAVAGYDSSKHEIGYSNEVTTNVAAAPSAPAVSGETASVVTSTSATISWSTDIASTSQVEYGTVSNAYTLSPVGATATTSHAVTLSALNPGTLYYYRVISAANGLTTTSNEFTFTTLTSTTSQPPPSIVISNVTATLINRTKANITWTTSIAAGSQVEYGTAPGAYTMSTPVDSTLVTNHRLTLTGLKPNRTYYFRVKSGNAVSPDGTSFVTR